MFEKYKNDQEFYSLVGIKPQTFKKMVEVLKEAEIKKKIKGCRKNKLSIEQRLFMTLEYWKEYNTYHVIAKRYNINHVSCIRNIFWVEDTLIKSGIFNLPGKKELQKNKGSCNSLLAIDATETPIERIKKTKIAFFRKKEKTHIKNSNNYQYLH